MNKFDPQGMYQVYDGWPKIAKKSHDSNIDVVDFKDINHIVYSGMGGSGAVGDHLKKSIDYIKNRLDL